MAEHPILFIDENVRAILDGRKTQTRRVIRQDRIPERDRSVAGFLARCPYGGPGDLLWVRETYLPHCGQASAPGLACGRYSADSEWFYAPNEVCRHPGSYLARGAVVPSIHMPKWACRLWLEVTDVRVQRVQEISEADAKAEGVDHIPSAPAALTHRTSFARLWDSVNLRRGYGWDANPWVWAITFKRTER